MAAMDSTMATTANTESTNITQKHCASECAVCGQEEVPITGT